MYRLQLTNLLLYGADPLIECRNEDEVYGNVFAFANKTLNDNMSPVTYSLSNTGNITLHIHVKKINFSYFVIST